MLIYLDHEVQMEKKVCKWFIGAICWVVQTKTLSAHEDFIMTWLKAREIREGCDFKGNNKEMKGEIRMIEIYIWH